MSNKPDKEKMCGKLKGGTCADGRTQRCYIPNEDALSSTISLGSVFTSLIFDSHKGRDLEIFGVSVSYLNDDIPEENSSY